MSGGRFMKLVALGTVVAFATVASALAQVRVKMPSPRPPSAPQAPAMSEPADPNLDLAYGAYQRGLYLTALADASKRAQRGDAVAMTLLGELYAQGLGVGQDDAKAAQWYSAAAAGGDRDAMFALAMFNLAGRGGPRNEQEGARLLSEAAKLGHPAANYDLGLLYLQGQQFPRDVTRAAELFRAAADAGSSEAQYALATMVKEGSGVPKDIDEAMRLMRLAATAGNLDAMVEFAIAQFNGEGTPKNEAAAARLFLSAARRGSPIAQDRLARILMAGRGMPADPTEAVKWHIIAKAGGDSDPELDLFAAKQTPQVRAEAEKKAKLWLSTAHLAPLTRRPPSNPAPRPAVPQTVDTSRAPRGLWSGAQIC